MTPPPGARGMRARLAALALALAVAGGGCDHAALAPAASATCTEIGSRCQLPGGPLGVCEQAPCAAGAPAPCFKCISQH